MAGYGPLGLMDSPPKVCDICFRSEIENVISAPAGTDPGSIGLIPMQKFQIKGEAGPYTLCEECQQTDDGKEIVELAESWRGE